MGKSAYLTINDEFATSMRVMNSLIAMCIKDYHESNEDLTAKELYAVTLEILGVKKSDVIKTYICVNCTKPFKSATFRNHCSKKCEAEHHKD